MRRVLIISVCAALVGGSAYGQVAPDEGASEPLTSQEIGALRQLLQDLNDREEKKKRRLPEEREVKSFFDMEDVVTVGGKNPSKYNEFRWQARLFKPSARIYFDVGNDAPGDEPDIFVNGSVTAQVDVIEVGYWWDVGVATGGELEGWGLGLVCGAGIGTPAVTVMDDGGDTDTSTAPVAILNVGLAFERQMGDPTKKKANGYVGLHVGYAQGFSTDEKFLDSTDGAIYVGVSVDF